jgi:hypothetical protein
MQIEELNVGDSKFFIVVGAVTCVATAGVFYVRKVVKKRTTKRKIRRSATFDVDQWEELELMNISEFLKTLKGMIDAYQKGDLTMSRERLRGIALHRKTQLSAEKAESKAEVTIRLEEMGSLLNEVNLFIMVNLIQTDHKSLNKLKYFFIEIATQIVSVMTEPERLLENSDSTLSFEEIDDLFTVLVNSSSTKRVLRAEAKRLKEELEVSWDKLRKSNNDYKSSLKAIEQWKTFFAENMGPIAEILEKGDKWWPES